MGAVVGRRAQLDPNRNLFARSVGRTQLLGWMLELELSERWKKLEKSRSKERSQLQQATAVTGRQLDDIKSGRIDWKTHV